METQNKNKSCIKVNRQALRRGKKRFAEVPELKV
jgi:hypothetical protein